MNKNINLSLCILIIGSISLFNSCKKKEELLIISSAVVTAGIDQTDQIETELEDPVVVMVKDQNGNPFQGALVTFYVIEGSLSDYSMMTDIDGKAATRWTLGKTPGTHSLIITILQEDGVSPLTGTPLIVNATVKTVVAEIISGDNQSAQLEETLDEPVIIKVLKEVGIPFSGASVNFRVNQGSVSKENVITDVNGLAEVNWTLGLNHGNQVMSVSVFHSDGTTPLLSQSIQVNATAVEASLIEIVSGNDQLGFISSMLLEPIKIIVKSGNGKPYSGVSVHFNVGEGSVSTMEVITGEDGTASVDWTLGSSYGKQTLTITAYKADNIRPLINSPLEVKAITLIQDIDNNTYKTVKIGDQIWMSENLKTTKYSNGDDIAERIPHDLNICGEIMQQCQWIYNGDMNNFDDYGRLYTWYTVVDSRNVCPDGWHVPNKTEWITLTHTLGGLYEAGGRMKEEGTEHWQSPNYGATNESGFTALPGGSYQCNGPWGKLGEGCSYWSSTEYIDWQGIDYGYSRYTGSTTRYLYEGYSAKKNGLSIRCVKD